MRKTFPILMPHALLASCGGGAADNNSSDAGAATVEQEQVPDNLTDDPQNSVVPVALPSPVALDVLPAAFAGRWSLTADDCERPRANAKGLMTITADHLSFYGSDARLSAARAVSPGRITATLDFNGKVHSWRRATALSLLDDGKTLVREEQDPSASFRYARCP